MILLMTYTCFIFLIHIMFKCIQSDKPSYTICTYVFKHLIPSGLRINPHTKIYKRL